VAQAVFGGIQTPAEPAWTPKVDIQYSPWLGVWLKRQLGTKRRNQQRSFQDLRFSNQKIFLAPSFLSKMVSALLDRRARSNDPLNTAKCLGQTSRRRRGYRRFCKGSDVPLARVHSRPMARARFQALNEPIIACALIIPSERSPLPIQSAIPVIGKAVCLPQSNSCCQAGPLYLPFPPYLVMIPMLQVPTGLVLHSPVHTQCGLSGLSSSHPCK
jgi:hypothetical protein